APADEDRTMTTPGSTPAQAPGVAQGKKSADTDPTMEDILASIRRILDDEVAAEPKPAGSAAASDVVELTEQMLVAEEPAKPAAELRDAPAAATARESPPSATAAAASTSSLAPEGLVGAAAASAAAASFQALRAATSAGAAPLPPKPETPVGQASLTLEEMVRQEIRPLLKSWLDENLPPLVERLVKAELERIARG
ncbi:MAG: DUF2497 domain-containing protein, partial [Elioraea sp.]|nr:DUF2497 domain-containing protein [Elioraea sp.]